MGLTSKEKGGRIKKGREKKNRRTRKARNGEGKERKRRGGPQYTFPATPPRKRRGKGNEKGENGKDEKKLKRERGGERRQS